MSTDADRTPTDQKILDVTPTEQKVLVDGGLRMTREDPFDSGPPTLKQQAERAPTEPQPLDLPDDGTPTGQKVVADGTPTDQKIVVDGTPTDQKIISDGTPTEQQVVSGSLAVGRGTVIDARWRTDRCLASGGYGDVWKGVDLIEDRSIAVKILRTDAGNNDPSAIARMRQEAEILKAISHPNIVGVYGFGDSPYGHFLVMEMLDGKAIDQLLVVEGPADPDRAIPVVRQLLEALSVAHSHQVFHRDLKPENIIIGKDASGREVAKLVDFGIAKATRLLSGDEEGATLVQTRAGGFMGTPRYAAPEQAVGDPCGPNIDLFALGLVIAEWLTGKMRIDAERHGDVMQLLLSPDDIDISDVPYRWREWLALMLKKNPRDRYQTADQALAELDRLVVKLHQKPSFLEDENNLSVVSQQPGGFAANDGPLELDFGRSRQPRHTPHPAPQSGPLPAPNARRTHGAPQMMRTVSTEEVQLKTRPKSKSYQITKLIFVLAVGIISFAAFAVLILIVGGLLN